MSFARITVAFEKVSVKGLRRWVDCEGKKRQQTKEFYQTISPFNRDAEGNQKTYAQIMVEIKAERDNWLTKANQEKGHAE